MHVVQQRYRDLFDDVLKYKGPNLFAEVVVPWLGTAHAEKVWLRNLARAAVPDSNDLLQEDSWRLYALSRIVDLLSLGAMDSDTAGAQGWTTAHLTLSEFKAAMDELGLELVRAPSFHPFFHEIVSVEQVPDPSAPPKIASEIWPGYRLGNLLISRARCRVVAGRGHLVKEVAEASVLYWAFARNNRRTSDLSSGWGSNSQWRTSFRLDYHVDGTYYYNHGGDAAATDEDADDDPLEPEEKLELLRHRSFVRCTKDGSDAWPYNWRAIELPNMPLQLTAHASYARAGRS